MYAVSLSFNISLISALLMNWPPSAKSPTSDLSTVPSKKSHSHFQSVYAQSMDRTQRIFWIWGDVTKVTEVESEAQHGAENKISTRSHCVYTSQPLFLSCDLPWTSSLRTVRGVCFCRSVLWYKLMKQIFCTHWLKWAECSPIILSWHHFCWGGEGVGGRRREGSMNFGRWGGSQSETKYFFFCCFYTLDSHEKCESV